MRVNTWPTSDSSVSRVPTAGTWARASLVKTANGTAGYGTSINPHSKPQTVPKHEGRSMAARGRPPSAFGPRLRHKSDFPQGIIEDTVLRELLVDRRVANEDCCIDVPFSSRRISCVEKSGTCGSDRRSLRRGRGWCLRQGALVRAATGNVRYRCRRLCPRSAPLYCAQEKQELPASLWLQQQDLFERLLQARLQGGQIL